MKRHLTRFTVCAGLIVLAGTGNAAEQLPQQPPTVSRPTSIALFVDKSGSMAAGKKEPSMKESAKLLPMLLDPQQELIVIDFQSTAQATRFRLQTPDLRGAVLQHIDGLRIGGGTDYVAAFRAANLGPGTPALFISDGEPNEGPNLVLEYLKAHPTGPLYTVAVEASPEAKRLLAEMAALTGGAFVSVDNSEQLVVTMLDFAKHMGQFRTFHPKDDTVECRAVVGKLIAFGFDATPALTGKPALSEPITSHLARLPGEHVAVAAVELAQSTDVTLAATQKRTPQGRLAAILRNDLPKAQMQLSAPGGNAPAGGDIKATTRFFDRDGKPIDPRTCRDLTSEFRVVDHAGQVVSKVTAKPSAKEPALEATLPLPNQSGSVTIQNITTDTSQGAAFEAVESRTVLLQKPLRVTVTPSSVKVNTKEGRFSTELKLTIPEDPKLQVSFAAQLEGTLNNLRLVSDKAISQDTVQLDFEVSAPGTYRGSLLIQGTATVALESVRVPFEIIVAPKLLGLALPESRTVSMGTVPANTKKAVTWDIPSLDTEEAAYMVEASDLSSNSGVVPLVPDQATIKPTKDKPARMTLTADVGNVEAGTYTGTVSIKRGSGNDAKQWRATLTLTVSESVTAEALHVGAVEVGKIITVPLTINNAGGPVRDLVVVKPAIKAKGGDIETTLPDKIDLIPAGQAKTISVKIAVSPLVESRGLHSGTITLRRSAGQEIHVPMQIEIVDEGQGPSAFLVAPTNLHLTAKPGDVLQFEVRIKSSADTLAVPEEMNASVSPFKDGQGRSAAIEVSFQWPAGNKLGRSSPVTAKGYLIAPDSQGIYTAKLTIQSRSAGTRTVPINLVVHQ